MRGGRGGARPGAGRPKGSLGVKRRRELEKTRGSPLSSNVPPATVPPTPPLPTPPPPPPRLRDDAAATPPASFAGVDSKRSRLAEIRGSRDFAAALDFLRAFRVAVGTHAAPHELLEEALADPPRASDAAVSALKEVHLSLLRGVDPRRAANGAGESMGWRAWLAAAATPTRRSKLFGAKTATATPTPFDDVRDGGRGRPNLETAIETRRAIAAAYDGARPATRATALWELCEMRFAAGRDLRDVVDAAAEANPESFPFRGPKALGADADGARYVLADDVVRGGGMRLYREGDAAWDDGWDDGWDDDTKTDEAKTDEAKTDEAKTDEATDSDARPPRPRISLPRHPFYVEDESSVVFLDDVPCMCCGRVDDEATFVLCDACPNGGHLACLGLERVPTGYWSCAVCASRRRAPVRPSPGPGSWEVVATDPEELAAVGARLTASGDATTLGAALSRDVADDVAAKFEREATRRAKKEAKAMRRANEEAKAAASAAAREEKRRRRAKRSAWWMCRRTEPGRKTRGAAPGYPGYQKYPKYPHWRPPSQCADVEDLPCAVCGWEGDEDAFVLCESCPNGGHFRCLGMRRLPTDAWTCAVCEGNAAEE